MFLLHQLTIVPGKPGLTEASVSLGSVPVDALTTVVARVVQTLVAVNAAFTVVGHLLAPGTAIAWQRETRRKGAEEIGRMGLVFLFHLLILNKSYVSGSDFVLRVEDVVNPFG